MKKKRGGGGKRKGGHCGNIKCQMTLKFHNKTNILFSITSSSDAMFEDSSLCFQYVNKRAAHVKSRLFQVGVDLGRSKALISLRDAFRLLGFYE